MSRLLFALIATEIFLGGGGRLITVGSGTLRMVLFAIALCASVVIALRERPLSDTPLALVLVSGFFLFHLPAVLIGTLRGASAQDIAGDVQPLLFWLIAPFFAQILAARENILLTSRLVRVAGIILGLAYIGVLAGLELGLIDLIDLYERLDATEEFSFRGEEAIFYKGFLYLCVAFVFLLALPGRFKALWILVVAAAIVLTLTRGFILSASLAAILLLLTIKRVHPLLAVVLFGVTAAAVLVALLSAGNETLMPMREESNQVRLDDLRFFASSVDVPSLLAGYGFGIPLNGRMNVENSYLWIVWKAGLFGLCFWLVPLWLSVRAFFQIPRSSSEFRLACAFVFSVVLVYIQTATNPYLNNPIGLAFVLIAMFSLRRLAIAEGRRRSLAPPLSRRPTPA